MANTKILFVRDTLHNGAQISKGEIIEIDETSKDGRTTKQQLYAAGAAVPHTPEMIEIYRSENPTPTASVQPQKQTR